MPGGMFHTTLKRSKSVQPSPFWSLGGGANGGIVPKNAERDTVTCKVRSACNKIFKRSKL